MQESAYTRGNHDADPPLFLMPRFAQLKSSCAPSSGGRYIVMVAGKTSGEPPEIMEVWKTGTHHPSLNVL
ncbi:unnamed protein product [Miscanthus lutarioriparius]|uniref:Uncharacterized protein n=1 Tax=Miscanthus lutarioriparius TaxID=422564 RepID=A0A811P9D8_9POAL|nr:unnamed protein product [Miscanthus lutarioriparius]